MQQIDLLWQFTLLCSLICITPVLAGGLAPLLVYGQQSPRPQSELSILSLTVPTLGATAGWKRKPRAAAPSAQATSSVAVVGVKQQALHHPPTQPRPGGQRWLLRLKNVSRPCNSSEQLLRCAGHLLFVGVPVFVLDGARSVAAVGERQQALHTAPLDSAEGRQATMTAAAESHSKAKRRSSEQHHAVMLATPLRVWS